MPRVLVVEDDRPIRTLLVTTLRRAGLDATGAEDGAAALEILAAGSFAVVLIDLMMPRMDGFTLTDTLAGMALGRRPIVMVMTAFTDLPANRLDPQVVHAFFRKPFDVEAIVETIRDAAIELASADGDAGVPPEIPSRELRPTDVC